MNPIRNHHPDLSRSCQRLISTMILMIKSGKPNMPVRDSGITLDSERKPRTRSMPKRMPWNHQKVDRGILPFVVIRSLSMSIIASIVLGVGGYTVEQYVWDKWIVIVNFLQTNRILRELSGIRVMVSNKSSFDLACN